MDLRDTNLHVSICKQHHDPDTILTKLDIYFWHLVDKPCQKVSVSASDVHGVKEPNKEL